MTLVPMLQRAFEGEERTYAHLLLREQADHMARVRYAAIERALIHNIERGIRYLRVPLMTGGQLVFDTHELDGDATGVK